MRGLGEPTVTAGAVVLLFVVSAAPGVLPGRRIVDPSETAVIAPVPGRPDAAPAGSYLTPTTCHAEYSAVERLIIHTVLAGPPTARAELPDGPAALHREG